MTNPPWLEEIRKQLEEQQLPPQYIERLIQELRDHHDDIAAEHMSMEPDKSNADAERLGQPAHLAQVAADEYRLHSPLYSHTQKAPFIWLFSTVLVALVFVTVGLLLLFDESSDDWMFCGFGVVSSLFA